MLTLLDYLVLGGYLLGVAALGMSMRGQQASTEDYFLGGRDMPWWAVCFSVVATETSTLTVIGVPAVSYGGALTFFQITIGYLLGRLLVSVVFLPRYYQGNMQTAYTYLGQRFGDKLRATASVTFLFTRLLADGVRLFATAIPIKVIATSAGFDVNYTLIIAVIGIVTIAYTYVGGIRAVIWIDVVQMVLYIGGGLLAIGILTMTLPADWFAVAEAAGKTKLWDTGLGEGLAYFLTQPYTLLTAVVGGAIFTMASHGTDQLIVQRLLACRSLQDSQKALLGSAVMVMAQFGLFLVLGLMLWSYYGGQSLVDLGLTRNDEIFPKYIIEAMPPGVAGLLLAGILAAAMSTLSSSLNALASSTIVDLYERFTGNQLTAAKLLSRSRWTTLVWGGVFILFASLFTDMQGTVVELGLSIASYTYGGLLGVFLLGLLNQRAREADAIASFLLASATLVVLILFVRYVDPLGWHLTTQPAANAVSLAWPWYTAVGAGLTVCIGSIMGLRHR